MNFTNINDPAGVKALLDQLRTSQAWQEISQAQPDAVAQVHDSSRPSSSPLILVSGPSSSLTPSSPDATQSHSLSGITGTPADPIASPSVASLLSQLQASSPTSSVPPQAHSTLLSTPIQNTQLPSTSYQSVCDPLPVVTQHAPLPSSARREDLRNYTFQHALPHIARLSEDQTFVDAIMSLKREQADLEQQLWEERQAIQKKHEDKVKIARNKARLIGSGLTQFEADVMSDAFRIELRKFDAERVLPAWDGLVVKQQAKLESLGVPAMYQTTMKADRERQQRITQVLAGIEGGGGV